MQSRITAPQIREMKLRNEKITMLTAYDYPTARILDDAGIEIALVGDSLGMAVLGFENTLPVTMEMMLHHTSAVVRGTKRALVLADMPFMSYHASEEEAIRNAGRLLQEAGAQAVKIEGGSAIAPTVHRITSLGIPVMGHVGMTPQAVHQFGGFRLQGKDQAHALQIEEDALAIQEAGAFAVVLELIDHELAKRITEKLDIPTIGIGAGPHCDGQVQVVNDIIGLYDQFVPKHARQYVDVKAQITEAIKSYSQEVKSGSFQK